MSNDDIVSSGTLSIHIPEGQLELDRLEESQNRSLLFYDEQIPIYIKLKLDVDGDNDIDNDNDKLSDRDESPKSLERNADFDHVAIAVEIKVVGSVADREQSYITHSEIVDSSHLVQKTDEIAIWKIDAPIEHPRTRLVQPRVVVDAVLNLGKSIVEEVVKPKEVNSSYLESFAPVKAINLFEALGHDSNLSRLQSTLSASRVALPDTNTKVSATPSPSPQPAGTTSSSSSSSSAVVAMGEDTPGKNDYEKLREKLSAAVTIPVVPALNLRLRTTKANGNQDNVVTILEISSAESSQVDIQIDVAQVELLGGSASTMGVVELPQQLSPGESWTISFNLYHSDLFLMSKEQQASSKIKPVSITVECTPQLSSSTTTSTTTGNSTTTYKPTIRTKWDTIVDFDINTQAPAPAPSALPPPPPPAPMAQTVPGTPSMKKIMRMSRTSSSTSLPSAARTSKWSTSNLSGLTISFSGPSTVKIGESFQWKVFAVNRSQVTRHLSLYIQPIDKAFEKSLPRNADLFPIIDRQSLKKMYQNSSLGEVGLISLSNDIRVGPLYAQSCYETEISILALSAGVHTLEGVTVLDQSNGEMYDCGRLLEVTCR